MALTEFIEQRDNPRELVDWLEESVDKNDDVSSSVVTLDSLVKLGIFRKEKLSVGTRFYLNNQGKAKWSQVTPHSMFNNFKRVNVSTEVVRLSKFKLGTVEKGQLPP